MKKTRSDRINSCLGRDRSPSTLLLIKDAPAHYKLFRSCHVLHRMNLNFCCSNAVINTRCPETLPCFVFQVDILMSLLTKLRNEDPSVKSLVVSQFTSMLDILETPLEAQGFNFVRLDGRMSQRKRAEVIESFDDSSPDSPTVMLLSLRAGGVGVNLTAASRVFLLDPVCRFRFGILS